jgi:hypothetical protein
MNAYHTYRIKFCYDGEGELESQIRTFKATSPGHAFKKCLQEYPGAKLIEGWREGGYSGGYAITTYAPPSTVRIKAAPVPEAEETHFPFWKDCVSHRPFRSASSS